MAPIAEINRRVSLAVERARPHALGLCVERLDRIEVAFVVRLNGLARYRWVRVAAIVISRGGDGWVYLAVAATLLLAGGGRGRVACAAAALSALVAHAICPVAKMFVRRRRPCDSFGSLERLGCPLDLYSCPSGHSMTAAAVFVVVGVAFPQSLPLGMLFWIALAWARLASAHHYPSDLVAGGLLGATAALPACLLVL